MITITRKSPETFAQDTIQTLPVCDRLDFDLGRNYDRTPIEFTGFRPGRADTLPLDGIWERDHQDHISSIYTDAKINGQPDTKERQKYRPLRQVDRVLVHVAPEDFNLERRVCYPGEVLSFESTLFDVIIGKEIGPSNRSSCVGNDRQYQVIVSQYGNAMVRTVSQKELGTPPKIEEIIYLNMGSHPLKITKSVSTEFLKMAFQFLPGFYGINLLTETEHGREIKVVVPACRLNLAYEALTNARYYKKEN